MAKSKLAKSKGFTLLEILLVVGIIAINPSKQLADARNAQRRSDLSSIANAIYQYTIEPGNQLSTLGITEDAGCTVAVSSLEGLLNPTYISAIPTDPTSGNGTSYFVGLDSTSKRITVCSDSVEGNGGVAISITK